MSINDPIGDMFTRVRNALQVRHEEVYVPFSIMKLGIAKILKEEGFVKYYEILSQDINKKVLKIGLKYGGDGVPVISNLKRMSKPGKRHYVQKKEIPKVMSGFGLSIISTSEGLLSGKAARIKNLGGEFVGIVY